MATSHAPSTRRPLVAIGQAHRLSGHDWLVPGVVRQTLKGILRRHGVPPRQAVAICTDEIRSLVGTCGDGLTGTRDRALLLLGYAGALRRAELVGVEREHLRFTHDGLKLMIPRSKGDPEGQGAELGIAKGEHRHTCSVRALEDWLKASACEFGPVFTKIDAWGNVETRALSPDAVRYILQHRARLAGLSSGAGERLSPHGPRVSMPVENWFSRNSRAAGLVL